MPTERKFRVYFAFFCYGGNGGIASISPHLLKWWGQLTMALAADPRIGKENFASDIISDTPITMTRNKAVNTAKKWGADVIVMLDSDNIPDLLAKHDGTSKPFFQSSFDFLVENWERGPSVICSPYCGPPPHPVHGGEENVYVFQWTAAASGAGEEDGEYRLSGYSREQAAQMKGIQECAAGPTGVIMYDMRAFDLISTPYFDYEWNADRSEKDSTEDVFNTRNISLAGCSVLGYNPMFCNWDAWAGHAKTKIVGPPKLLYTEQVAETYKKAVRDDLSVMKRTIDFEAPPIQRQPMKVVPAVVNGTLKLGDHLTAEEAEQWVAGEGMGVKMQPWDLDAIRRLVEEIAVTSRKFVRVIEVGTWIGNTAKFIHQVLDELGVPHRIDCVDTFAGTPSDHTGDLAAALGGSTHQHFIDNVGDLRGSVIFEHVGLSTDVALSWQDKADLIFLDADHTYQGARDDIAAWKPHLRNGGILCGHDYQVAGLDGVTHAVHELSQLPEVESVERVNPKTKSCVWAARFKPQYRATTLNYPAKHSLSDDTISVIDCVPNLQPV